MGVTIVTFASPVTLLVLAFAPAVLLIVIGVMASIRSRTPTAIPATALATGLALLVLVLLVVGAYSVDGLHGVAESQFILLGLPLASFAVALSVLAHRGKLPLLSVAACGIVGLMGLCWLGGFVLMLSACSFGLGGC